jgi:hypothetical protein
MIAETDYYKVNAVNQSSLGNLAYSPRYYKNSIDNPEDLSDREHFKFGSLVDCLITAPEEMDSRFAVSEVIRPVGQLGDFIDQVHSIYSQIETPTQLDADATRLLCYKRVGFKRDSLEKVIERVKLEASEYVEFLNKSVGKTVVTHEEYKQALEVAESLKASPFTGQYLDSTYGEGIYQMPIYFKYDGVECKALLDRVIFDHKNGIVYPVDVKTTSQGVLNFPKSFIKWRYYLQAAFYTEAIRDYLIKEKLGDYTIEKFRFLVAERSLVTPPIVFVVTTTDLLAGTYGGKLTDGTKVKGFAELIADLKWHIMCDLWDYPREIYEAKGAVELNCFQDFD